MSRHQQPMRSMTKTDVSGDFGERSGYTGIHSDIVALLEAARHAAARAGVRGGPLAPGDAAPRLPLPLLKNYKDVFVILKTVLKCLWLQVFVNIFKI